MPHSPFVDSSHVARYASGLLARTEDIARNGLLRREFRLPFLDVTAYCSDDGFADICERGLVDRGRRERNVEGSLQLHVMCAGANGWPRPATWREASFSPVGLDRIVSGESLRGYYNHEHRFWQFYDPACRRGVQSMAAADRFPPWEASGPLRAFLHWAYDEVGMRLTHAATLGREGRGVLLAGGGGSGKSGTTLAGIVNGLDTAGDDYVLLDRGPTYRAHAVFSRMKQDVAGLRRAGIESFALSSEGPNWQDKIEFDPRAIRDEAMTDSLEIDAILLPSVARAARTTLEPARPAAAMMALAPSGVFQMPGGTASGMSFFARLARRVPAFHLALSENAAEIAEAVGGFLETRRLAHAG